MTPLERTVGPEYNIEQGRFFDLRSRIIIIPGNFF